jgi:hypothetical protein
MLKARENWERRVKGMDESVGMFEALTVHGPF